MTIEKLRMKQISKATQFFIVSGILLISLLIPITALSEETPFMQAKKPIICTDSTKMLKWLSEEHKESPVVIFNDEGSIKSQVIVFIHVKKETATVIEMLPNGFSCILAAGNDATIIAIKEGRGT